MSWRDNAMTQSLSLIICAGHSSTDPGATANGTTEAKIVAEFRNLVAESLEDRGVFFHTDGMGDENWPLRQAADMAKQHDIAVEFHCNAAGSSQATGTETLSGQDDFPLGLTLAEEVSHALGIKCRGAKGEQAGPHSRLAFVQAGGIILELFFITNPNDLAAYQAHKLVAAKAVAATLAEVVSDDHRK